MCWVSGCFTWADYYGNIGLVTYSLYGHEGAAVWMALIEESKKEWPLLSKRMNKASSGSLRELMGIHKAYEPKDGPLQSASRDCVVEKEVSTRIWTPE